MTEPKTAIIFDLGGVLIDWNPRYLYRKLIADEAVMEQFLTEVCRPEWNAQQDHGRPFAEAIAELVARFPAQEAWIRAWWERWPETMNGAVEGTVTILNELRESGHRLFALSNWSAETYPHAEARFEFLQWFEYVALSGRLKLSKPQPEIFAHLLDRIGQPAAECVFIDDSLANIAAARRLGIQALHFTSPESLRAQLRALSLLAPRT